MQVLKATENFLTVPAADIAQIRQVVELLTISAVTTAVIAIESLATLVRN